MRPCELQEYFRTDFVRVPIALDRFHASLATRKRSRPPFFFPYLIPGRTRKLSLRVAAITMLSELETESYNVPGTYNPDTYAIAGNYRKAVASQQSLTTSSCDINKIACAIATFPKFCSIALDAYEKIWGEEDWQDIAGFDRRVFVSSEDINSGQNNLEFTFNRILQAIAQAQTICQANGRRFNLCSLTARAFYASDNWCPDSHQNIRLQSLDIHPFSRRALQAALSRLTLLCHRHPRFCH